MIQRGKHASFAFQSGHPIGVARECFRQEFDRHATAQFRVCGLIDFTHATGTDVAGNLVMSEFLPNHESEIAPGMIPEASICYLSLHHELVKGTDEDGTRRAAA